AATRGPLPPRGRPPPPSARPGGPPASGSAPSASCWSSCCGGGRTRRTGRLWRSSTAASPCGAWSGRWSSRTTRGSRASSSSPGCGTTPACTRGRRRPGGPASAGRSRAGGSGCRRRGRGAAGPAGGGGGGVAWRGGGGGGGGGWQIGEVFLYGRRRSVRWKEVVCLWRVLGHGVPVKAVVAEVEGFRKRFTLVTSAVGLSGLQVVELFGARYRQEDAFRDLK